MLYQCKYNSPIGELYITADEYSLLSVSFSSKENAISSENNIIKTAKKQLDEYFSRRRKVFDLPINPIGTEFQKKVWAELIKIPYGKTRTYKEIALSIGSPKAVRAVGNANNKNPIAIIIPCHRVIGSNGKLIGYRGGLDKKQKLLNFEYNSNQEMDAKVK